MNRPKQTSPGTSSETPRKPPDESTGEPEAVGPQPPSPTSEDPGLPLIDLFTLDPSSATNEQIQDCVNGDVVEAVEKSGLHAK